MKAKAAGIWDEQPLFSFQFGKLHCLHGCKVEVNRSFRIYSAFREDERRLMAKEYYEENIDILFNSKN